MKLAMLTSVGLSVVAAAALASQSAPTTGKSERTKSCCAKKPAAATADSAKHAGDQKQKMRCSLTGKVIDTCCCVEREGKTHCTLADKDVAECCCSPVEEESPAPAKAK